MKRFMKVLAVIIGGFIILGLIGAALGGSSKSTTATASSTPQTSAPAPAAPTPPPAPATTSTAAAKPAQPSMTESQKNAIDSAKSYLSFSAFSRRGLIQQLSSSAGEGFPRADAVFAVNHLGVDWNAEAGKAAKQYLQTEPFSRAGLIEQLASSAGAGFTHAQAVYGVNQTGL
jgi:hypothetical protein